jgi:hypothetical protein
MQDNPNATDPISLAAAASVGFTAEMHRETYEHLMEKIRATDVSERANPQILDLIETAIYHAAYSGSYVPAPYAYDGMRGYAYFGNRLGEYRRGLRITEFVMQLTGADYIDVIVCPAHDNNLYLLALGQPGRAEENTRHLLEYARALAQSDQSQDRWGNPLAYFRDENFHYNFSLYEAVFLQTLCDALLAQGKLAQAEALMSEVLSESRNWEVRGHPHQSRNGSNPYGRRAVARALSGDVDGARSDFEAADEFSAKYSPKLFFRSHDWHHRVYHAALLARLGYLPRAQRRLERMNLERIRAFRPWTSAEIDLTFADIAYAREQWDTATEHVNRAFEWAAKSGHKSVHLRASLIKAKLHLRAGELDKASELLETVEADAKNHEYMLQQVDALILKGYLALLNEDSRRAELVAWEAESISQPLPYRWAMGDAAHLLARCAEAQGKSDDGIAHAKRALDIRQAIQDPKASHTRALLEHLKASE